MAEFVEVMKQKVRMCESYTGCMACKLHYTNNGSDADCAEFFDRCPEKAEQIIMEWAAAHPEPKFPSWNEAWKRLFPNAYYCNNGTDINSPCIKHFLPHAQVKCAGVICGDCLKQPIPADIAEKLGIKLLEE